MDLVIREDLSPTEKATACFDLIKAGREAVKNTTQGYMMLGMILETLLGKGGLWKYYASHITTKDEFVKDAFRIGLSEASHIRRCSKKYSKLIGERVIPFNRLLSACPVVNNDNAEEILNQAEALPQNEWQNTIKILKGGLDKDACEHEDELFNHCKKCGRWEKV